MVPTCSFGTVPVKVNDADWPDFQVKMKAKGFCWAARRQNDHSPWDVELFAKFDIEALTFEAA